MIEIKNVSKYFGDFKALNNVSCTIEEGTIYGLIGSNGAGKSTLERLLAGVYKAEEGSLTVNGKPIFENTDIKNDIFYLSDELFFLPQSTMNSMAKFYAGYYDNFSYEIYNKLCSIFPLKTNNKISSFSKGMQRQAGLILAFSCNPKILLLDEAFDGIDPVIRNLVKNILVDNVAEHNTTVIISSHNLRELEDLCDHIALIHQGGLLLDKDLDSIKSDIFKFHCGFHQAPARDGFKGLDIMSFKTKKNLVTLVARGKQEDIEKNLMLLEPLFMETLPLTLEEVFIQEMEVSGYDFKNIL